MTMTDLGYRWDCPACGPSRVVGSSFPYVGGYTLLSDDAYSLERAIEKHEAERHGITAASRG